MMDDTKLKKLELNVATLNHKVNLHESMHAHAEKRIGDVEKLVAVHEETLSVVKEIAEVAKKTYDIIVPLVESLRWVAIAVAWAAKIAAGFAIIWHAGKWLAAKIMVFS
jgi:hypothetical protein